MFNSKVKVGIAKNMGLSEITDFANKPKRRFARKPLELKQISIPNNRLVEVNQPKAKGKENRMLKNMLVKNKGQAPIMKIVLPRPGKWTVQVRNTRDLPVIIQKRQIPKVKIDLQSLTKKKKRTPANFIDTMEKSEQTSVMLPALCKSPESGKQTTISILNISPALSSPSLRAGLKKTKTIHSSIPRPGPKSKQPDELNQLASARLVRPLLYSIEEVFL